MCADKSKGRISLRSFFPKATPEQLDALVRGQPVPPSVDWKPGIAAPVQVNDPKVDFDVEPPLVSMILVFGEPRRERMARKCINRFLLQTYQNKELVIVNTSGVKLTNKEHPAVRERMLPDAGLTIGEMRNVGLDEARGQWVTMLDDDDLPSFHLLSYLVAHCEPGKALALAYQLRVSVVNANGFLLFNEAGVPSTLFYQPTPETRYAATDSGDTLAFWTEHFSMQTKVLSNNVPPASCMSLAVHQGHNVTPVEEFMRDYAAVSHHGRLDVRPEEREHITNMLKLTGMDVQKIPQDKGA